MGKGVPNRGNFAADKGYLPVWNYYTGFIDKVKEEFPGKQIRIRFPKTYNETAMVLA
jgi:hypothetical protein